jgi:hypothetical protein
MSDKHAAVLTLLDAKAGLVALVFTQNGNEIEKGCWQIQ